MQALTFDNPKTSYFTVLLAAAVLYIATCAPGPVWQDSGMLQYRVWHNDIEGGLGLALAHPLFYILAIGAKSIPFGNFAYKVNLLSTVIGAVAVANLFLLLRLWLGKNLPALLSAITLALSHTFWRHATIPETYNLAAAFLLAELIMLLLYTKEGRRGYLYLLALLNGLAISNHMLASIAFICYLVFLIVLVVKKQIRGQDFGIMALLWIVGALPYEYLIIKNILQTGNFTATISSAVFGTQWQGQVLNTTLSLKLIKENLIFIAYNFPTPNIILFFTGFYGLKRISPTRSFSNIILALLILFFAFAFRYTISDRYAFFIPFYCLVSVLIGTGFNSLATLPKHKALCRLALVLALLPIPAYIIAPAVAQKAGFNLGAKRNIPYRNDYTWFLQPWRTGPDTPEKFATETLTNIEDNAIVIADGTTVYPLWHAQTVKRINTGVRIVAEHSSYQNPIAFPTEDTIEQLMAQYPVYVVSPVVGYCPKFLLEHYDFVQKTVLWKAVNRK